MQNCAASSLKNLFYSNNGKKTKSFKMNRREKNEVEYYDSETSSEVQFTKPAVRLDPSEYFPQGITPEWGYVRNHLPGAVFRLPQKTENYYNGYHDNGGSQHSTATSRNKTSTAALTFPSWGQRTTPQAKTL
ncbi:hypothetical protein EB796_018315 [Bugula neritina]|uniref:Uncharacterized protein n=1 Tax=Bugula neritina TaxID=10212 RepID=A0A7J7JBQ8_BUGNE|nr:hypothetical protein EB796_018315 [Bugula neritina]